ncbi:MAG TPA: GNAT family N-acetyltransferase [Solirubrobacterales bacterium]|nr:GNAT family N-acetyltransferase [Solirubrobacterales bacterium]
MIEVSDNADESRYEVRVDGELAGFAQYRRRPAGLAFVHTEIDDRFEGQGLGGRLVSHALDEARSRGLSVLPICPFVRSYIARHPEYLDLVPEEKRSSYGLA